MLVLDTFAKRLLAARAVKRLSRAALAQTIGTNEKRIQRLEHGVGTEHLSLAMLQRLSQGLGVSVEWLVWGEAPQLRYNHSPYED